jgi:hypothetical protein
VETAATKRSLALPLVSCLVFLAGCTSPQEEARREAAARQAQEERARAPQDRQEVLARLRTYTIGKTTSFQFRRDAGFKDQVNPAEKTIFMPAFNDSKVWRVTDMKMQGSFGNVVETYTVGYSGGPLAYLEFKGGILSSIRFI